MNELVLGLDIGTSSVKAVAFDFEGKVKASATIRHPLYSPYPGWAEQDPSDWRTGAFESIRQVVAMIKPDEIKVIGLSGQSPSHALIDHAGNPLGMAIIWRDQRARQEAEWLARNISEEETARWTGLNGIATTTLSPARLLWLKNHRPEDWQRTRFIAHPKDFIGLALTGEIATDMQTAFTLVNPATGQYDPEYFARLGIPTGFMPVARLPVEIIGGVSAQAASLTGIKSGTPVIAGTIDAFCDSLAGGANHPGRAVVVAGTSEVVSLGTAGIKSGKGVYLAEIGHEGHFLCGPTQAGGDTLTWLGKGFFSDVDPSDLFEKLETEASSITAGSGGVIFLPYLNGERAPVWDSLAKGCFFGLSFEHTRKHCARAVYEGVGYSVRHVLETCEEIAGTQADQIVVCGGGSRSQFWNQIKADILQRPIFPAVVRESACLGAAILACVGSGIYPNLDRAVKNMLQLGSAMEPRIETTEQYQQGYRIYRGLYPALKPLFHEA